MKYEFTFRVEMTVGDPANGSMMRTVEADSFHAPEFWVEFYRKGVAYWRVNKSFLVSMETVRNA